MDHYDVSSTSPIAILCEDWARIRERVLEDTGGRETELDRILTEKPDYLADLRGHHRFVDANPAALKLLGIENLTCLNSNSARLLPADPAANVVRAILRGESCCQGEREIVTPDGSKASILWRTRLPLDAQGYQRVYFFAVDIGAQKRAQGALSEAKEAVNHAGRLSLVGELSATLVHEIAQPISSIRILAGAIDRNLAADVPHVAMARDILGRLGENAIHASEIVTRIRDFSRPSKARFAPAAPAALVNDALALLEPEIRRNSVSVNVDVPDRLPCLLGDDVQIKQVLVNIVLNAIQALSLTDTPRDIMVRAIREQGQIAFAVSDSGPGFADPGKAFQPFYTTKSDGLGLGLSVCRRIVEDHGGTMALRSGMAGTQVLFSIPVS